MNRNDTSAPLRSSDEPDRTIQEYFRCAEAFLDLSNDSGAASEEGFFTFCGAVCYGKWHSGAVPKYVNGTALPEAWTETGREPGKLCLPMDLSEVVTNLRRERYRRKPQYVEQITGGSSVRSLYYALRPILGIAARKHLQRLRLAGWETIPFPSWPVDVTVDTIMRNALMLALKAGRRERIPFVWFWPGGAEASIMMTHDVEGRRGAEFCDALMDLDESFQIKSSFQIIPTSCDGARWHAIRLRGFEVNLHDWNHDGRLFQNRAVFLERAAMINRFARDLGCRGFRSAVMYRQQDWYDAFDFDYDMSVPNVAHLDPQRGGCCTVMPYFVGHILELPLTTVQDYSLFHILKDYSISLWKTQIDRILSRNGLISFIIHPDYVRAARANAVYVQLLEHLDRLRSDRRLWVAPPGEIETWWRQRNEMRLIPDGTGWRVDGPGAEQARVAYAVLENDRVVYQLDDTYHPAPSAPDRIEGLGQHQQHVQATGTQ